MQLADAVEIILRLVRSRRLSSDQREACNVLEDFAVNHAGDD